MFRAELSFFQCKFVACAVCCEKLVKLWLQTELFLSAPKEIPLTPKLKPSAIPEVQHVVTGNCAHHSYKLINRSMLAKNISARLPKMDRSYAVHEHLE